MKQDKMKKKHTTIMLYKSDEYMAEIDALYIVIL